MWFMVIALQASVLELGEQAETLFPTCEAASALLDPADRTKYLQRHAAAMGAAVNARLVLGLVCGAYEEGTKITPPMAGARKAKDGFWYVERGGKYLRLGN